MQPSSLHNCSICLHKVQTYIYIFADDEVLIADCPIKLQYLLDALGLWSKDNQMMINHDKSKIIHFRHPKKKVCQSRFSCSETPIQYTDSYKYLGVEFTEYFSCVKSVENTAISAKKAASYLIAKTYSQLYGNYHYLMVIFSPTDSNGSELSLTLCSLMDSTAFAVCAE